MSQAFHNTRTSTQLLNGLRDAGNDAVWQEFVTRYQPLLSRYCLKLGLRDADAADVTQQILLEFSRSYQAGKYDREKGRLRQWLYGIAHNQVRNWRRRQRNKEVQIGADSDDGDFFARIDDEHHLSQVWEEEWQDSILRRCLHQVRAEVKETTYRAFELFALEQKPADEVAALLQTTANAVFSAKRRILRRIRELMPDAEEFL
ncbi:MAG: RNA polymerase sigma factor [Phycisphaerae bacterium]